MTTYIYFDAAGRIIETVSSPNRKGDEGVSSIFVYWEGMGSAKPAQCLMTFRKGKATAGPITADAIADSAIPYSRLRELRAFEYGKLYKFIQFAVPADVTSSAGYWSASAQIVDGVTSQTVQTLGDIAFEVQDSAVVPSGGLTLSQYNYLLSRFADAVQSIDDKLDEPKGDARYLVKAEGAGDQGVNNRSVFSEGLEAQAHKSGRTRFRVNSVNTFMQNEAGDAKIDTNRVGVLVTGNFAVNPEGNAPAFQSTGTGTMMSDPTGAHRLTATPAKMTAQGGIKSDTAPTEEDDLATKAYVDQAVATGGDLQLNIENGTGGGSLKSRSAKDASGSMSLALGFNASASGGNSIAIGSGADNQADHGVAFGYGVTNKGQTGSMAFGKYYRASDAGACFTFGWMDQALFTLGGSSNSFLKPTTFQSDVEVLGTFTARRFESVEAENLTTGNFTIGLGKGNATAVETLMGMYCEKYDGANYGCLAWDKTGTAYVGDCQVGSDGAISDPSKTLQPILTRDRDHSMADGCAIFWDATRLKAVTNSAIRAFGLDGVSIGGVLSVSGGKAEYSGAIDGDACVATKKYVDDAMSPVVIRRW